MKLSIKGLYLMFITLFLQSNMDASQPRVSMPTISTLQEALFNVRKSIINFPADDLAAAQAYEKKQAIRLVQCAKVLYDNAREQILQTLQEIDHRLAYWRYQKNHPWVYFRKKNPLKWFMGKSQDIEVEHNLEQLQSHQGELYVLLGQLAEHGTIYDHEYKTIFVADDAKAYAWIDGLLNLLARIKVTAQNSETMSPFILRATLLKLQLTKVRSFKNIILSEMPETQIPAHIEQNWLTYISTAFLFGYGYKNIGMQQIVDSFESVKKSFNEIIVNPVQATLKDVFIPGQVDDVTSELLVPQANIDVTKEAVKNFVNDLTVKAGYWEKGDITAGQKTQILEDIQKNNFVSFHQFTNELIKNWKGKAPEAKALLVEYFGFQGVGNIQKKLVQLEKQWVGLGKIAVLTPAILSGWLALKGYQAFRTKDYTPIRRALVDINSLFVDTTKPLDDERYGKMIYLVYDLKKQAEKMVPVVDRTDFLKDLEKIESKEFDVAAKRRIVDDMFRKYSFLKLV